MDEELPGLFEAVLPGASSRHAAEALATWKQGLANLSPSALPLGLDVSPDHWHDLVRDALRLADQQATQAAELGWSALDLFGVHARAPAARYDVAGLAVLLRGGEVIAMDLAGATIRMPSGATLSFQRRPQPGAVPLWEL